MSRKQSLALRLVIAIAALGLLASLLTRQYETAQSRWSVFLAGNPKRGVRLFERKGCVQCHAVNGWGADLAPDLGMQSSSGARLSELVTAMWNHAPQMWEHMQANKIKYPSLTRRQMADLFAFFYLSGYFDEPGEEDRGERLFISKQCRRCHEPYGRKDRIGPNLGAMGGLDTPIVWAEAMWNHAPAMEKAMEQLGLPWPTFEDREMNDLLAYIRRRSGGLRREREFLPADPIQGRTLFRNKGCTACHSVGGKGTGRAPDLGPRQASPLTLIQFAGVMWNHSPGMWRAMEVEGVPRPTFEGQEMADIMAFLASLRCFEPGGSPQTGESLITERGCAPCHGQRAEGASGGPALRGPSRSYTLVTFAEALWNHGPKMYRRTRELGRDWPSLDEDDIGDLLAFLNTALPEDP